MRWGPIPRAWPLAARAQQRALVPVIGFINSASPSYFGIAGAFRDGLKEGGYVEGQNVAVEYRWAEGHYDRLPALVRDLVDRQVAVILAGGGTDPAKAAQAATTKIPIVFVSAADPVRTGLVASLSRPGGNITGISLLASVLDAKKLGLFRELVPQASVIGALINPIAALLPFISLGGAHDANCAGLLAEARSAGAPVRTAHIAEAQLKPKKG